MLHLPLLPIGHPVGRATVIVGQRCCSYRDVGLSGYSRKLFCVSMHAISYPLILLHIGNNFGIETQDFCTHTLALNQSCNPIQIKNQQSSRNYFSCDLQQQYVASQTRKSCTAVTFSLKDAALQLARQ